MAQKSTQNVPQEVVDAARAAAERGDTDAAAQLENGTLTTTEAIAKRNYVEFGSEEHEKRLGAAYGGLTREDAKRIISEREKDPHLWPWEKYQQAKRFLKELDGRPKAVATNKHWTRDQV